MVLVAELESIRVTLTTNNDSLQTDLDAIKTRVSETSEALEDAKRYDLNTPLFQAFEFSRAERKLDTTRLSSKTCKGNTTVT